MSLDFQLSDQQVAMRNHIASACREFLAPQARIIDKEDAMPKEVWRFFAEQGFPAMPIPKAYGGSEHSLLDQTLMMEEVTASGHSPVCVALLEAAALFTQCVLRYGTEEQKMRWLPALAKGEINAAFALTEPGVGSDPANMATQAVRDGDEYVITGRKRYVSFGNISELILVFATTDPSAGKNGVSAFVVERSRPGFSMDDAIPCIGLRGHQDEEMILDNVRVPADHLVGEEGQGLVVAMKTLERTRTTLCGGYVGLARAAVDAAIWYANRRKSFGKTLGEHQALRFPMAETVTQIEAARWMTWRAACLSDDGVRHGVETAQAKIMAGDVLLKACDLAFTVYGGFAGTQKYVVERFYRDAKIWSYAQGSPEIMREIVARDTLKRETQEPLV